MALHASAFCICDNIDLFQNLLECQFDSNIKFKDRINELLPEDMRVLPIGRDKNGLAYWYMMVGILCLFQFLMTIFTVELQGLECLWNNENMFKTGIV